MMETDEKRAKRMAMICWSSDLDRVWPVLILGTTAAASGLEVDIFFTFWGLRVLQRNDKRITGQNWMQKCESLVDRGGTDHLKLGKIHFGGAGTFLWVDPVADIALVALADRECADGELSHLAGCRLQRLVGTNDFGSASHGVPYQHLVTPDIPAMPRSPQRQRLEPARAA